MTDKNPNYRILHIVTSLELGGAQMMLLKLLSKMDRQHISHEVVSLMDAGVLGADINRINIPVYTLDMGRLPGPLDGLRLIRLARKLNPDVIQGWMYHGNLASSFVSRFLPRTVPTLWNVRHSIYDISEEKRMTSWIIRLCATLSNLPNRILYNSKVGATQHEVLGFRQDKRLVIPNCFDTQKFCPSEEARNEIRAELGLPPSAIIIGHLARCHPMKDHSNLIRAGARLSARNSDVHFLLAGKNVDDNNDEIIDLINQFKLRDKFHLLGERRDISKLAGGMDIFTSSSFGEGFPNVIGEAMACGVPCVVTDVGDSSWVVGETGKVISPRDPEALANGWMELLELGEQGRRDLGRKARERILTHFPMAKIVSQYDSLYKEVLSN